MGSVRGGVTITSTMSDDSTPVASTLVRHYARLKESAVRELGEVINTAQDAANSDLVSHLRVLLRLLVVTLTEVCIICSE